jgi:ATP-dependent RNA helicase DeaD
MGFESLGVSPHTVETLRGEGFVEPMEVQKVVIPLALRGEDLVVRSKTGSGKTLAFGVPMAERIRPRGHPQALVLLPTRELAQQVASVIRSISRLRVVLLYGGASIDAQRDKLRAGCDVIVATPGRLMDMMRRGHAILNRVRFVVLDEADRMLDMGFIDDVSWILSRCPDERQTMLFSATMPAEVKRLAERHTRSARWVYLDQDEMVVKHVEQYVVRVGRANKLHVLSAILEGDRPEKTMVFTRTRRAAEMVYELLRKIGYRAVALHGDRTQRQRNEAIRAFREGKVDILVATDVASRGLDVEDVTHIVNYDIPYYPKDYVHRVGRTGRAGKKGKAYTFVERGEEKYLRDIENLIEMEIPEIRVDGKSSRVRRRIDFDEMADIYGMVKLRLTLKEPAHPGTIATELSRAARISDELIGRVEVHGDHAVVEVHKDYAMRVMRRKPRFVARVDPVEKP